MRKNRSRILYYIIVIVLVVGIAMNFIKLPYFITQPGTADALEPMVTVENGYKEKGTLRLVTILEGQANVLQYLKTKLDFNKYTQVLKQQQIQLADESPEEMEVRQLNYMDESQIKASYVAYKAANKHPKLQYNGVLVVNVNSKMPVAKVLKVKDVIVGAEGKPVHQMEDLAHILKNKKLGDSVNLKIKRGSKTLSVTTKMARFPDEWVTSSEQKKIGLGILQGDDMSLDVDPPVKFNTKGIGGPSAGLMMTLEIYNQLTKEDVSKGHDICGTGEIFLDGTVGPIGGIKQKIVAADKAGAEYFFAPTAEGEAKDAEAAAKDIGTDMKIVPVSKFDDALKFLQKLN
ncbi:PDZ domain-containing protein [Pullulanibacillus pueri]|uniref:endopeptidase La n=1 Tax=Pullulanibacillus pueri TaxID=1437324 RepID=A0A8J2ZSY9_9BACL|nr:SepM family pheromone-processing serine protease [Pullulanibacillus pueri]MBM7680116.1 PDZ domain-containing protein [Pullulanibacillus pueri]GGH74440.1 hypothetical protein GCM10007096_02670 [Pullulanibacillus pueri]